MLAIELVDDALEHADEDHGLARRVLQVLEQRDHLAGEQAVGAADIGLAGLLAERLGPGLGPGHALAGQLGDAVDEDDPLRRDQLDQVRIGPGDVLVVAFGEEGARVGRRIDAADQAGDVDGIEPAADRDAVARPVLDGFHAGLEVDAQRRAREQGPEQRRLADARRTEDRHGGLAVRRGQTLVGGDDVQSHRVPLRLALEAPACGGRRAMTAT